MTAKLKPFDEGDIARMYITHRWATNEGWATGGMVDHDRIRLYERIDLNTFPGCDDFKGENMTITCGDIVMVLGYVGRPLSCTHKKIDSEYDVYDILVNGKKLQALRWNLEHPKDYDVAIASAGFS